MGSPHDHMEHSAQLHAPSMAHTCVSIASCTNAYSDAHTNARTDAPVAAPAYTHSRGRASHSMRRLSALTTPLSALSALLALPMLLGGCSSFPGEINPGDSTYMESGAVAVDARTETMFTLLTYYAPTPEPSPTPEGDVSPAPAAEPVIVSRELYAIRPDDGSLQTMGNVFDVEGIVLQFPPGQVLLTGYQNNAPMLRTYDANTLEQKVDTFVELPHWGGLSLADSGAALASLAWPDSDQSLPGAIYVTELETQQVHQQSVGQWYPAVAWTHQSETLVASLSEFDDETGDTSVRLVTWKLAELQSRQYAVDATGQWLGASIDVHFPDTSPDLDLLLGRITLSPDDSVAVLPLIDQRPVDTDGDGTPDETQGMPSLKVISLATGAVTAFDDTYGPVGFTPDGSTLVAYRYHETTDEAGTVSSTPWLVMVDLKTMATEELEVPTVNQLQYFVTREGHFVVIDTEQSWYATDDGSSEEQEADNLMIYDVDTQQLREISDSAIELGDYISRIGHQELWSAVGNNLYRVNYSEGTLETTTTSWTNGRMNYLPSRDLLVLSDRSTPTIRLVDPTSRMIRQAITLPIPEGF